MPYFGVPKLLTQLLGNQSCQSCQSFQSLQSLQSRQSCQTAASALPPFAPLGIQLKALFAVGVADDEAIGPVGEHLAAELRMETGRAEARLDTLALLAHPGSELTAAPCVFSSRRSRSRPLATSLRRVAETLEVSRAASLPS